MLCLTNTGFVQCFSFGSRKVSYTLLLRFSQNFVSRVLFSNFCFPCFASQTPGLCSAFPSAPVKFVACLCLILLYSVIFCFACFASQISCLCNALPSALVVCCTLLLPWAKSRGGTLVTRAHIKNSTYSSHIQSVY